MRLVKITGPHKSANGAYKAPRSFESHGYSSFTHVECAVARGIVTEPGLYVIDGPDVDGGERAVVEVEAYTPPVKTELRVVRPRRSF